MSSESMSPEIDITSFESAIARLQEGLAEMSFQDLIRSGNEQALLLSDWSKWKTYREMRAKSSHTYAETVAQEVVTAIPEFLAEAMYLADKLKQHTT